jgi:serine/threonine protein kinase
MPFRGRRLALAFAFWLLVAPVLFAQELVDCSVTAAGQTYVLTKFLGTGAYGQVYEARPEKGGPSVALKVLGPGVAGALKPVFERLYDDSPGSRRFVRSGREVIGLVDPHTEFAVRRGIVISELAHKSTFEDIMPELRAPLARVAIDSEAAAKSIAATHAIAKDLIEGLDHLVSRGLLHGDIKAANILFVGDTNVPVTSDSILAGTHRAVFGDLDGVARSPIARMLSMQAPEYLRGLGFLGVGMPVSDHYSLARVLLGALGSVRRDRPTAAWHVPPESDRLMTDLYEYIDAASIEDDRVRLDALSRLAEHSTLLKPRFAERYRVHNRLLWILGGLYDSTCAYFRMQMPASARPR